MTIPRVRQDKLLEAARGYLMLDMPDQALRQLDAIEAPKACWFDMNQLRGDALREKQEYKAALKAYHWARKENPTDVSVLLGMAWCYKRTNQLTKAIASMHEAYQWSSDQPIVLYNLACYYALAGDKSHALSWLGRALRMDSSLRKLIPKETDFDQLRYDPDFQLIAGMSENISKAS